MVGGVQLDPDLRLAARAARMVRQDVTPDHESAPEAAAADGSLRCGMRLVPPRTPVEKAGLAFIQRSLIEMSDVIGFPSAVVGA
ncbi:hypothetical protein GCM10023107_25290 [Actinoplanes octamycinicus]|nr:hypothetical protein Aoc01nite_57620 [Actinoplanes octamycinicus]